MYQQILLNYSDACTHAYMFMCVTLNGVHMSVCVQLSEHTQACWCLHIRRGPGGGSSWYVHVGCVYTSCNMLHRDKGTSS